MRRNGHADEVDVVAALTELGGVAPHQPLVAATSRRRLRTALTRGRVVRLGFNRYALPPDDRARDLALKYGGHLSHLSAARHWGWAVKFVPERPQLLIPDPPPAAHALAEVTSRGAGEVEGWATSRIQTVLDCAADLPFDEALAVADSALRTGDLSRDELRAALPPDAGEDVRRVVEYADRRAANPFESCLRAICIEIGHPVVPQWAITVRGGVEVHADLANPFLGIAIEADSWAWHAGRSAHERDCDRYNWLVEAGWLVLRFYWQQVMHAPHVVADVIHNVAALRVT